MSPTDIWVISPAVKSTGANELVLTPTALLTERASSITRAWTITPSLVYNFVWTEVDKIIFYLIITHLFFFLHEYCPNGIYYYFSWSISITSLHGRKIHRVIMFESWVEESESARFNRSALFSFHAHFSSLAIIAGVKGMIQSKKPSGEWK